MKLANAYMIKTGMDSYHVPEELKRGHVLIRQSLVALSAYLGGIETHSCQSLPLYRGVIRYLGGIETSAPAHRLVVADVISVPRRN